MCRSWGCLFLVSQSPCRSTSNLGYILARSSFLRYTILFFHCSVWALPEEVLWGREQAGACRGLCSQGGVWCQKGNTWSNMTSRRWWRTKWPVPCWFPICWQVFQAVVRFLPRIGLSFGSLLMLWQSFRCRAMRLIFLSWCFCFVDFIGKTKTKLCQI